MWACTFMHFDRMKWNALGLQLTMCLIHGQMAQCNKYACDLYDSRDQRMVCVAARYLVICGQIKNAMHALLRVAHLENRDDLVPEDGDGDVWRALVTVNDPDAWVAFSMWAWRGRAMPILALRAASRAASAMEKHNLDHTPLTSFHTLAMIFTAIRDPIMDCPPEKLLHHRGEESIGDAVECLRRLLKACKEFGKIYPVSCLAHVMYCETLLTTLIDYWAHIKKGKQTKDVFVCPPNAQLGPKSAFTRGEQEAQRISQPASLSLSDGGESPVRITPLMVRSPSDLSLSSSQPGLMSSPPSTQPVYSARPPTTNGSKQTLLQKVFTSNIVRRSKRNAFSPVVAEAEKSGNLFVKGLALLEYDDEDSLIQAAEIFMERVDSVFYYEQAELLLQAFRLKHDIPSSVNSYASETHTLRPFFSEENDTTPQLDPSVSAFKVV